MSRSVEFSLYDQLRKLSDTQAVLVFSVLSTWRVLCMGAGGPAGVTVAARINHVTPQGAWLLVGFAVGVIHTIATTVFPIALSVLPVPSFLHKLESLMESRLRHYVIRETSGPAITYERDMRTGKVTILEMRSSYRWSELSCSYIDIADSRTLSLLFLTVLFLALFCMFIGVPVAYGVGLSALALRMLNIAVSEPLLIASIPTIFLVCGSSHSFVHTQNKPHEILWYAVAAIVFVKTAESRDFHVANVHAAASAGAVFGSMVFCGELPYILLRKMWPIDYDELEHLSSNKGSLASKLFPRPYDLREPLGRLKFRINPGELSAAEERARLELSLHPDMKKVYWSRLNGLNKNVHYVLIVDDWKYELRDFSERRDRSDIRYHASKVFSGRHDSAIYARYLIGWTQLTHEYIDSVCRELGDNWRYRLIWKSLHAGNCQHFLRQVSKRLIEPVYYASNWNYFQYDRWDVLQREEDNLETEDYIPARGAGAQWSNVFHLNQWNLP